MYVNSFLYIFVYKTDTDVVVIRQTHAYITTTCWVVLLLWHIKFLRMTEYKIIVFLNVFTLSLSLYVSGYVCFFYYIFIFFPHKMIWHICV